MCWMTRFGSSSLVLTLFTTLCLISLGKATHAGTIDYGRSSNGSFASWAVFRFEFIFCSILPFLTTSSDGECNKRRTETMVICNKCLHSLEQTESIVTTTSECLLWAYGGPLQQVILKLIYDKKKPPYKVFSYMVKTRFEIFSENFSSRHQAFSGRIMLAWRKSFAMKAKKPEPVKEKLFLSHIWIHNSSLHYVNVSAAVGITI